MAGKKSINARNLLVAGDPRSTIDHCREVLSWMISVTDDEGGNDFGRSLVLRTIEGALAEVDVMLQAKSQAKSRPALEVVNG